MTVWSVSSISAPGIGESSLYCNCVLEKNVAQGL